MVRVFAVCLLAVRTLLLAGLVAVIPGCSTPTGPGIPPFDCSVLTSSSNVRFTTEFVGVGRVQLDVFSQPDGRKLGTKCDGFTVTNPGGIGTTFNVEGRNGWVKLAWVGGSLAFIDLRSGWVGSTDRNIKLGATKQAVVDAYPQAVPISWYPDTGSVLRLALHPEQEYGTAMYFHFDKDSRLAVIRLAAV